MSNYQFNARLDHVEHLINKYAKIQRSILQKIACLEAQNQASSVEEAVAAGHDAIDRRLRANEAAVRELELRNQGSRRGGKGSSVS